MGQTTLRAILGVRPAEWSNPLSVAEAVTRTDVLDPAELMIFAAASMQVDEALGSQLLELARGIGEGDLPDAKAQLAGILRGTPASQLQETFSLAQTRFGETAQVVGRIRQVLKQRAATAAESISETDAIQIAKEVADLVEQEYMGLLRYCLENPEVKFDTDFGRHLSALHQTLSASIEAAKKTLAGHLENRAIQEKIKQMESIADWISFGAEQIADGRRDLLSLLTSVFETLEDRMNLSGAVLNAIILNADKAREKGIQIFLDIPKGIRFPDEDTAIHLGEAVRELIKNAIKYSDPEKPKRWVRIYWRPLGYPLIVADNGLGIQDTGAVWNEEVRERAGVADGLGIGLGTVGGRLNQVHWIIKVESTVGQGTTFSLCPLGSKTLQYEENYDRSLYRLQQTYYQTHGRFDLATLVPEVVAMMTEKEQIELGKQLFQHRYEFCAGVYSAIQQLKENDLKGLKELKEKLRTDLGQTDKLFRATGDVALNSSSAQLVLRVEATINLALSALRTKKKFGLRPSKAFGTRKRRSGKHWSAKGGFNTMWGKKN